MKIKVYDDVKRYAVISSIEVSAMQMLKKRDPLTLFVRDEDGNDIFGTSYNANHNAISTNNITFGAVHEEDGKKYAMFVGEIPEGVTPAEVDDFICDKVTPIQGYLKLIEERVPAKVEEINVARTALINTIERA